MTHVRLGSPERLTVAHLPNCEDMYIPAAGSCNYDYTPPDVRKVPASQPKRGNLRQIIRRLSMRALGQLTFLLLSSLSLSLAVILIIVVITFSCVLILAVNRNHHVVFHIVFFLLLLLLFSVLFLLLPLLLLLITTIMIIMT